MRGILLLNGEPYSGRIEKDGAFVVCADGAYSWAKGKIDIDCLLGDMDSCPEDVAADETYPAKKDFTDGEAGLYRLVSLGAKDIDIYGGFGKREDHFLGNLQLLYKALKNGARARMVSERCVIFCGEGRIDLSEFSGKTFSVFSFGDSVKIAGFSGVEYPYPETLSLGETRGVSNVAGEGAYIETEGVALVVANI